MAIGSHHDDGPVVDINVTPLIDVMLVLLVIFMITAPLVHHDIRVDLPQPNPKVQPPQHPPAPHTLFIQPDGAMSWDQLPITRVQLLAQLAVIGAQPVKLQPQVHIKASADTRYGYLARVMAAARRYNVQKIGFEK